MNLIKAGTICALMLSASASYGQSATLTADGSVVPAGAAVTLTASAYYTSMPGAVGWSLTLPEGWTFVATTGPDIPQVGPETGATGTLEWAYADVPANAPRFSFTVKTSGKSGPVRLQPKLFLRIDGKQREIEVAPLGLAIQ